jgi:hypothetical protein
VVVSGSEAAAVPKLLRLLHAMSWASSSSSTSSTTTNGVRARVVLPEAVEMFCNILLGKAKPPPPEEAVFEDTLNSSVERALRYYFLTCTLYVTRCFRATLSFVVRLSMLVCLGSVWSVLHCLVQ